MLLDNLPENEKTELKENISLFLKHWYYLPEERFYSFVRK